MVQFGTYGTQNRPNTAPKRPPKIPENKKTGGFGGERPPDMVPGAAQAREAAPFQAADSSSSPEHEQIHKIVWWKGRKRTD